MIFLKDNLIEAEAKTFVADETQLTLLGFTQNPRLYPKDVWTNTSLPVVVTYVTEFQESQAVGLIASVSRVLPNNTVLVYDLGIGSYGLRTVRLCKWKFLGLIVVNGLFVFLVGELL